MLPILTLALWSLVPQAAPAPPAIELREALAVSSGGRGGRSPVRADAVVAQIVTGKWAAPKAGDHVEVDGKPGPEWRAIKAGSDGTFRDSTLRGTYVYVNVPSQTDQVMILEAVGHDMVYVSGEPRTGDPYSHGYVHLPVFLRKGDNSFLFAVGRGSLKARLVPPKQPNYLDLADVTLPELVANTEVTTWAGVVVINASTSPSEGLTILANLEDRQVETTVPSIPPLGSRKIAVKVSGLTPAAGKTIPLALKLSKHGKSVDDASVNLTVRAADETRNSTFISEIDGSVQYYGFVPAKPDPAHPQRKPSLLLSLHGAGVEGAGQARVYSTKPGLHIVAPTNRRSFGFDWEDWGRLDAIEVLDLVSEELGVDPRRTYLSGHSMGGHGTWHLGVTYPSRFAAIAPSAGWVSMFSYAGMRKATNPSPMEEILQRCSNGSDTLTLVTNLEKLGVYILHGDADDNVPVGQARDMRKTLSTFHPDFAYYERAGAGHWWGNECCDWPPLMEFLKDHERPSEIQKIDFITANPGISATCDWVTIEAQIKALMPSEVHLRYDPNTKRVTGTTKNVARISFTLPGDDYSVTLDNDPPFQVSRNLTERRIPRSESPLRRSKGVLYDSTPRFILSRDDDRWHHMRLVPASFRSPVRSGPFKDVFRNRMLFVYGTKGTPEENNWALSKARFDAETFGYRGNGSIDVIPDTEFKADSDPDRNVILYGNADSNAAWNLLLEASPIQVLRGKIKVGERLVEGDDLGCLFIQPRLGSASGSIGVVSGTGPAGMRTTDRLPCFSSGVAYPDLFILGADSLSKGIGGVRCAGFFAKDWGIEGGEFIWNP